MDQRRGDWSDRDVHTTTLHVYNNGLPDHPEGNHSDVAAALRNVTFGELPEIRKLLLLAMATTLPAKEILLDDDPGGDGDELVATFEGVLELARAYRRVDGEYRESRRAS